MLLQMVYHALLSNTTYYSRGFYKECGVAQSLSDLQPLTRIPVCTVYVTWPENSRLFENNGWTERCRILVACEYQHDQCECVISNQETWQMYF